MEWVAWILRAFAVLVLHNRVDLFFPASYQFFGNDFQNGGLARD